ncbi:MAG: N-formylglutamate amidohydrolase, partial [Pseudomonadota bacterium]
MQSDAYEILRPLGHAAGTVFSSPHSGREYPEEFVAAARLDRHALRASEDVFVDQLFAAAPACGAPMIAARLPRAWLDLNRAPSELDPALIDGVAAQGLNQRVAAGLGVVPRVVAEGTAIYHGKISRREAEARIERLHKPYHAALDRLLKEAREQHGKAVLYDCHSMPAEALRAAPRVRGRSPDIVLGDRFGAAAGRATVAEAQAAFEREGFLVARNAPFAGGYITQRYGRPSRGIEAVQIEINRALYLDGRTL